MNCFHPLKIKDRRAQGIRLEDKDTPLVYVPCGKCVACLSKKRSIWAKRLQIERKFSTSALFVTLTYDDCFLPITPNGLATLSKRDVQNFFKRLRKCVAKVSKTPLRYFISGEYGPTTLRPHYHAIIFNFPVDILDFRQVLVSVWKLGFVQSDFLKDGGGNYAAKYIQASLEYDYGTRQKPFSLMSRNPGIGMQLIQSDQFKKFIQNAKKYHIHLDKTNVLCLPQSFRNKVFDEKTKEEMYNEFLHRTYETFSEIGKKFESSTSRVRESILRDSDREQYSREQREHKMIKSLTKKHPYAKL